MGHSTKPRTANHSVNNADSLALCLPIAMPMFAVVQNIGAIRLRYEEKFTMSEQKLAGLYTRRLEHRASYTGRRFFSFRAQTDLLPGSRIALHREPTNNRRSGKITVNAPMRSRQLKFEQDVRHESTGVRQVKQARVAR